jgi:tRNA-uridine 2-sulfurtransferase
MPTTADSQVTMNRGLDKAPGETRVVVAMSGGVDSSVVAAMLAEAGFDVVGVTLQLYDHGAAMARKGACCAGRDIHDARRVAERMGFRALRARLRGPLPRRRDRRFRRRLPRRRDADSLHPLQRAGEVPRPAGDGAGSRGRLHGDRALRAADRGAGRPGAAPGGRPARDQSYFLFATTREQLGYLRFPLGGLASKAETRALAARYGLPVADKPDSQDICFVPHGDYAAVIERLRPGAAEPGEIVHLDGRVLGRHDGVMRYTVGQRRGLGLGAVTETEPLFVVASTPRRGGWWSGPRDRRWRRVVRVDGVNWLGDAPSRRRPRRAGRCWSRSARRGRRARRGCIRPGRGRRGRAPRARGGRGAGAGLRLLCARRRAGAGRRLDRPLRRCAAGSGATARKAACQGVKVYFFRSRSVVLS